MKSHIFKQLICLTLINFSLPTNPLHSQETIKIIELSEPVNMTATEQNTDREENIATTSYNSNPTRKFAKIEIPKISKTPETLVETINPVEIRVDISDNTTHAKTNKKTNINIKTYIIEAEPNSIDSIMNEIKSNHPNIKLEKVFRTAFHGVAISVENRSNALTKLKKEDQLKNVQKQLNTPRIVTTTRDSKATKQPEQLNHPNQQNHPNQLNQLSLTSQSNLARLKALPGIINIHPTNTYQAKLEDSVPFIGGDAIRRFFDRDDQHLTGKGIKVGVIDTGIDYTHPDLQKNYQGGFDLVDDDHDPMETVKSQGEPTLHGTHVAGIIAANGRVKGVAPEAEIYAYRALGPGGVGTSDQVIAAIEKAVEDGMDVINLSLGSSVNGPDYPTSVALDRAVEKGVIAVTSNGNSGPNLWSVGSPGSSQKAISVGASTPPIEIPYVCLNSLPDKKITLQPLQGAQVWNLTKDYKIIDGGSGTPEELQEEQIKGNIVLVERGKIPFAEKVKNVSQKGAKAVLIYNNEKGSFAGSLEEKIDIPAASISREDGLIVKAELKKGTRWLDTKTRKIKDQIADFSSRGPVTHSWSIKPDVVAPGVEIDSTVPDGYLALRGTSMSSPHVAGAAALIKQAHPDWSPEQVKAALMNTAKPLQNDQGQAYIPYEQGAGRIQVDKAIAATVLAYPASLAFGSIDPSTTAKTKSSLAVTLENKSAKPQKVSFHTPKYEKGLNWGLPLSFNLGPKEKKNVPIHIEVDSTKLSKGLHHGTLEINTSSSEIGLPYLFVVGDPNHPRVMGFSFEEEEDNQGAYKYELYLPEGADEIGIALFDPMTLKYIGLLSHQTKVERGVLEQTLTREEIPFPDGAYEVIVYAVQGGMESFEQSELELGSY